MKNLAELKKTMVLGRRLEMLSINGQRPEPTSKVAGVREVVAVQTNGVYLAPFEGSKNRSWFEFPKAANLDIHTSKHFTITDTTKTGEVWCKREYLINN